MMRGWFGRSKGVPVTDKEEEEEDTAHASGGLGAFGSLTSFSMQSIVDPRSKPKEEPESPKKEPQSESTPAKNSNAVTPDNDSSESESENLDEGTDPFDDQTLGESTVGGPLFDESAYTVHDDDSSVDTFDVSTQEGQWRSKKANDFLSEFFGKQAEDKKKKKADQEELIASKNMAIAAATPKTKEDCETPEEDIQENLAAAVPSKDMESRLAQVKSQSVKLPKHQPVTATGPEMPDKVPAVPRRRLSVEHMPRRLSVGRAPKFASIPEHRELEAKGDSNQGREEPETTTPQDASSSSDSMNLSQSEEELHPHLQLVTQNLQGAEPVSSSSNANNQSDDKDNFDESALHESKQSSDGDMMYDYHMEHGDHNTIVSDDGTFVDYRASGSIQSRRSSNQSGSMSSQTNVSSRRTSGETAQSSNTFADYETSACRSAPDTKSVTRLVSSETINTNRTFADYNTSKEEEHSGHYQEDDEDEDEDDDSQEIEKTGSDEEDGENNGFGMSQSSLTGAGTISDDFDQSANFEDSANWNSQKSPVEGESEETGDREPIFHQSEEQRPGDDSSRPSLRKPLSQRGTFSEDSDVSDPDEPEPFNHTSGLFGYLDANKAQAAFEEEEASQDSTPSIPQRSKSGTSLLGHSSDHTDWTDTIMHPSKHAVTSGTDRVEFPDRIPALPSRKVSVEGRDHASENVFNPHSTTGPDTDVKDEFAQKEQLDENGMEEEGSQIESSSTKDVARASLEFPSDAPEDSANVDNIADQQSHSESVIVDTDISDDIPQVKLGDVELDLATVETSAIPSRSRADEEGSSLNSENARSEDDRSDSSSHGEDDSSKDSGSEDDDLSDATSEDDGDDATSLDADQEILNSEGSSSSSYVSDDSSSSSELDQTSAYGDGSTTIGHMEVGQQIKDASLVPPEEDSSVSDRGMIMSSSSSTAEAYEDDSLAIATPANAVRKAAPKELEHATTYLEVNKLANKNPLPVPHSIEYFDSESVKGKTIPMRDTTCTGCAEIEPSTRNILCIGQSENLVIIESDSGGDVKVQEDSISKVTEIGFEGVSSGDNTGNTSIPTIQSSLVHFGDVHASDTIPSMQTSVIHFGGDVCDADIIPSLQTSPMFMGDIGLMDSACDFPTSQVTDVTATNSLCSERNTVTDVRSVASTTGDETEQSKSVDINGQPGDDKVERLEEKEVEEKQTSSKCSKRSSQANETDVDYAVHHSKQDDINPETYVQEKSASHPVSLNNPPEKVLTSFPSTALKATSDQSDLRSHSDSIEDEFPDPAGVPMSAVVSQPKKPGTDSQSGDGSVFVEQQTDAGSASAQEDVHSEPSEEESVRNPAGMSMSRIVSQDIETELDSQSNEDGDGDGSVSVEQHVDAGLASAQDDIESQSEPSEEESQCEPADETMPRTVSQHREPKLDFQSDEDEDSSVTFEEQVGAGLASAKDDVESHAESSEEKSQPDPTGATMSGAVFQHIETELDCQSNEGEDENGSASVEQQVDAGSAQDDAEAQSEPSEEDFQAEPETMAMSQHEEPELDSQSGESKDGSVSVEQQIHAGLASAQDNVESCSELSEQEHQMDIAGASMAGTASQDKDPELASQSEEDGDGNGNISVQQETDSESASAQDGIESHSERSSEEPHSDSAGVTMAGIVFQHRKAEFDSQSNDGEDEDGSTSVERHKNSGLAAVEDDVDSLSDQLVEGSQLDNSCNTNSGAVSQHKDTEIDFYFNKGEDGDGSISDEQQTERGIVSVRNDSESHPGPFEGESQCDITMEGSHCGHLDDVIAFSACASRQHSLSVQMIQENEMNDSRSDPPADLVEEQQEELDPLGDETSEECDEAIKLKDHGDQDDEDATDNSDQAQVNGCLNSDKEKADQAKDEEMPTEAKLSVDVNKSSANETEVSQFENAAVRPGHNLKSSIDETDPRGLSEDAKPKASWGWFSGKKVLSNNPVNQEEAWKSVQMTDIDSAESTAPLKEKEASPPSPSVGIKTGKETESAETTVEVSSNDTLAANKNETKPKASWGWFSSKKTETENQATKDAVSLPSKDAATPPLKDPVDLASNDVVVTNSSKDAATLSSEVVAQLPSKDAETLPSEDVVSFSLKDKEAEVHPSESSSGKKDGTTKKVSTVERHEAQEGSRPKSSWGWFSGKKSGSPEKEKSMEDMSGKVIHVDEKDIEAHSSLSAPADIQQVEGDTDSRTTAESSPSKNLVEKDEDIKSKSSFGLSPGEETEITKAWHLNQDLEHENEKNSLESGSYTEGPYKGGLEDKMCNGKITTTAGDVVLEEVLHSNQSPPLARNKSTEAFESGTDYADGSVAEDLGKNSGIIVPEIPEDNAAMSSVSGLALSPQSQSSEKVGSTQCTDSDSSSNNVNESSIDANQADSSTRSVKKPPTSSIFGLGLFSRSISPDDVESATQSKEEVDSKLSQNDAKEASKDRKFHDASATKTVFSVGLFSRKSSSDNSKNVNKPKDENMFGLGLFSQKLSYDDVEDGNKTKDVANKEPAKLDDISHANSMQDELNASTAKDVPCLGASSQTPSNYQENTDKTRDDANNHLTENVDIEPLPLMQDKSSASTAKTVFSLGLFSRSVSSNNVDSINQDEPETTTEQNRKPVEEPESSQSRGFGLSLLSRSFSSDAADSNRKSNEAIMECVEDQVVKHNMPSKQSLRGADVLLDEKTACDAEKKATTSLEREKKISSKTGFGFSFLSRTVLSDDPECTDDKDQSEDSVHAEEKNDAEMTADEAESLNEEGGASSSRDSISQRRGDVGNGSRIVDESNTDESSSNQSGDPLFKKGEDIPVLEGVTSSADLHGYGTDDSESEGGNLQSVSAEFRRNELSKAMKLLKDDDSAFVGTEMESKVSGTPFNPDDPSNEDKMKFGISQDSDQKDKDQIISPPSKKNSDEITNGQILISTEDESISRGPTVVHHDESVASDSADESNESDEQSEDDDSDEDDEKEEDEEEEDVPKQLIVKEAPLLRLENVTAQTRSKIPESKIQRKKGSGWGWFLGSGKVEEDHEAKNEDSNVPEEIEPTPPVTTASAATTTTTTTTTMTTSEDPETNKDSSANIADKPMPEIETKQKKMKKEKKEKKEKKSKKEKKEKSKKGKGLDSHFSKTKFRKFTRHGDEMSVGTMNLKSSSTDEDDQREQLVLNNASGTFDDNILDFSKEERPWDQDVPSRKGTPLLPSELDASDMIEEGSERSEDSNNHAGESSLLDSLFADEFSSVGNPSQEGADALSEVETIALSALESTLQKAKGEETEVNFDDMWDTMSADVSTAMEYERKQRENFRKKKDKKKSLGSQDDEDGDEVKRLRLFEKPSEKEAKKGKKGKGKKKKKKKEKLSMEFLAAIREVFDEEDEHSDKDDEDDDASLGSEEKSRALMRDDEDDDDNDDRDTHHDDEKSEMSMFIGAKQYMGSKRRGDTDELASAGSDDEPSLAESDEDASFADGKRSRSDDDDDASRKSRRSRASNKSGRSKRSSRTSRTTSSRSTRVKRKPAEVLQDELKRQQGAKLMSVSSLRQEMSDRRGTSVELLKKEFERKKLEKAAKIEQHVVQEDPIIGRDLGNSMFGFNAGFGESDRFGSSDHFSGFEASFSDLASDSQKEKGGSGLGNHISRWDTDKDFSDLDDLQTVQQEETTSSVSSGAFGFGGSGVIENLPIAGLSNVGGISPLSTDILSGGPAAGSTKKISKKKQKTAVEASFDDMPLTTITEFDDEDDNERGLLATSSHSVDDDDNVSYRSSRSSRSRSGKFGLSLKAPKLKGISKMMKRKGSTRSSNAGSGFYEDNESSGLLG